MTIIELIKWSQEALFLVGIIGGCIAAFKGIHEVRSATLQRLEELRWRRAQAARDVLHEMHLHKRAATAILMFDRSGAQHTEFKQTRRHQRHEYSSEENKTNTISYADALRALGDHAQESQDDKDDYIRECFDWFLYYLDRIEHYIRTHYIDFIDVESVFRPYVRKILHDYDTFDAFLTAREYSLADAFLKRYKTPNQTPQPTASRRTT